ncbi:MAG TPA: hypothetical protein VF666_00585 [Pyrinomonadaceae bacterium]
MMSASLLLACLACATLALSAPHRIVSASSTVVQSPTPVQSSSALCPRVNVSCPSDKCGCSTTTSATPPYAGMGNEEQPTPPALKPRKF